MRRGFTLVELAVWLAIIGFLAAILFPVFQRPHEGGRGVCQTNLKQLSLGIKQYIQDNDERFPSLAAFAGWRDAVTFYVGKDVSLFHCPLNGEDQTAKINDYWFNARLSGVKEEVLEVQSLTVMLGDGYSTTDPRVAISQLPQSWIADPKSPARRHLDGLNFAFVDGHVKWLKPDKITIDTTKNMNVTFAIR